MSNIFFASVGSDDWQPLGGIQEGSLSFEDESPLSEEAMNFDFQTNYTFTTKIEGELAYNLYKLLFWGGGRIPKKYRKVYDGLKLRQKKAKRDEFRREQRERIGIR